MPDPTAVDTDTIVETGKHVGIGLGSSTLMGALMMWLRGKEAERVATQLALIDQKLGQLTETMKKHEGLSERVALLERDVKAFHERLDGSRARKRR